MGSRRGKSERRLSSWRIVSRRRRHHQMRREWRYHERRAVRRRCRGCYITDICQDTEEPSHVVACLLCQVRFLREPSLIESEAGRENERGVVLR